MLYATRSLRTVDHDEIRAWVMARGGRPSVVRDTWNGTSGILRIDFDEGEEDLEELQWKEFFRVFRDQGLIFFYQEQDRDGRRSRAHKFISRDFDEEGSSRETEY